MVPVVNLWFPYQVVRDLDRLSEPRAPASARVGTWWALWLVTLVVAPWANDLASDAVDQGTSEHEALAATLGLVLVASTLAALVLWVVLVRRIVRHQRARFELEELPVRT